MSSTPKVPITSSLEEWARNLPAGFNVVVHNEVHNSVLHPESIRMGLFFYNIFWINLFDRRNLCNNEVRLEKKCMKR